jgi:Flp pilus assembly protein TadD
MMLAMSCGSSTPSAQTETASTPSPALEGVPSASASPRGSESDSAPTPELLAGIRAFDAGKYGDAQKLFETATRKNQSDPSAFLNLGLACEKAGDRTAAESAYKAALARKPDLESAVEELGALYIDEDRATDAIAILRPATRSHPSNGALHENLGVALASHGDAAEARAELEQAVRMAPHVPMYRLTLAHWLVAWRDPEALTQLDTARELAKGDIGLIVSVGFELRMAGAFAPCVKTFDRAIEIQDGGEVRTERALCKLGLKDDHGARADLQAAVEREPGYGPAHYYLAGRLAADKNFVAAATEYQKYLTVEPNGSLSKQASERLKAAKEAASGGKGSLMK